VVRIDAVRADPRSIVDVDVAPGQVDLTRAGAPTPSTQTGTR
jgi:hypothetical protein